VRIVTCSIALCSFFYLHDVQADSRVSSSDDRDDLNALQNVHHPDAINPPHSRGPQSELHVARLAFDTTMQHGWGPGRPWWRIDWPEAEMHFLEGLERYTVINSSTDSAHITLDDPSLFDYPWLFAQQVGRWYVTPQQAENLGEYLQRGGFLLAYDLHGPDDWASFSAVMQRALPGFPVEDISPDDPIMEVLYSIEQQKQIPGKRHIAFNDGQGNVQVNMPYGPAEWKGIRGEQGSWMVAINFNMDMGDAWEHADDPHYPLDMTSFGYQLGINYILYALTH